MPTSRAARGTLAGWGVTLFLTACTLPMPDLDSASRSSGYPQIGSGYSGSRDRDEYRGTLPSGSYTESCRDMRVDRDRRRLEAECRRPDGRWRETSLDLRDCDRGIANRDGRLVCPRQETVRLPAGSYQESCRDFSVDGRSLGARCRRRNGEWQDTAIDLSRCKKPIRNDDGRLVCG